MQTLRLSGLWSQKQNFNKLLRGLCTQQSLGSSVLGLTEEVCWELGEVAEAEVGWLHFSHSTAMWSPLNKAVPTHTCQRLSAPGQPLGD